MEEDKQLHCISKKQFIKVVLLVQLLLFVCQFKALQFGFLLTNKADMTNKNQWNQ